MYRIALYRFVLYCIIVLLTVLIIVTISLFYSIWLPLTFSCNVMTCLFSPSFLVHPSVLTIISLHPLTFISFSSVHHLRHFFFLCRVSTWAGISSREVLQMVRFLSPCSYCRCTLWVCRSVSGILRSFIALYSLSQQLKKDKMREDVQKERMRVTEKFQIDISLEMLKAIQFRDLSNFIKIRREDMFESYWRSWNKSESSCFCKGVQAASCLAIHMANIFFFSSLSWHQTPDFYPFLCV